MSKNTVRYYFLKNAYNITAAMGALLPDLCCLLGALFPNPAFVLPPTV